jgi:hypothetical protein
MSVRIIILTLAKGGTVYSIGASAATDDYAKMEPSFSQSIATFVLEND